MTSPAPSLRVGVLIDSLRPAAWIRRALDEIRASAKLSLVLLVLTKKDGIAHAGKGERPCLLSRLYACLDRALRKGGQDAFTRTSIDAYEYGECVWIENNGSSICDVDLAAVRNADLDVIVNLSSIRSSVAMVHAAAHGVWQFYPPDPGTAGAKVVSDQGVITDELRAYDQEGVRTVRRIVSTRDRNSRYREQNRRLWRRSASVVEQLGRLQTSVPATSTRMHVGLEIEQPQRDRLPGNLRTAGMLAGTLVRGVRDVLHRNLLDPDWFVAVREQRSSVIESSDMSGFRLLRSPRDRYYADPFVFEEGGRHFVFLEDYQRRKRKGAISFFPISHDKPIETVIPTVVLEMEYHLSYPTLFRWEGGIFMLAETSAAGRIEVFRAADFPNRWEPYAVLIGNIEGYDPTMVEYGGKFWLFCTGGCDGENSDLFVFYADTPFGKWRAHAGNPVVSDPYRARPAGGILVDNGQVYRPGQDCSRIYGGAVTFNRIEVLTETEYREVPTARIDPDWFPGNVGTHSFNQNGRFQVVDGRTMRPRWRLGP